MVVEELGVHPGHPDHVARVDGVGPQRGLVDGGDAVDRSPDRRPLPLARQGRRRGRHDRRRGREVRQADGVRRRGRAGFPDGPDRRTPPDRWRMVAVPEVLHPVHDRGPAVATGPLGETRRDRAAEGGVGERGAEGDPEPEGEAGQDEGDRRPRSPPGERAAARPSPPDGPVGHGPNRRSGRPVEHHRPTAPCSHGPTCGTTSTPRAGADEQAHRHGPLAEPGPADLPPGLRHEVERGQPGGVEEVTEDVHGHRPQPQHEARLVQEEHRGAPCRWPEEQQRSPRRTGRR